MKTSFLSQNYNFFFVLGYFYLFISRKAFYQNPFHPNEKDDKSLDQEKGIYLEIFFLNLLRCILIDWGVSKYNHVDYIALDLDYC